MEVGVPHKEKLPVFGLHHPFAEAGQGSFDLLQNNSEDENF